MPRANRTFLPGYVWHITHRCHEKKFLLKFARDRARWRHWLLEAKKRYGLCVLNYVITSNHVHLLVKDTGGQVIARSLQLVAGRTAQDYNTRKRRKGAFWEDRYHATAVSSDEHFIRCLVYIDLNMVRAGVVKHPAEWQHGGYQEIQHPPQRYRVIDIDALLELINISTLDTLQSQHRQWLDNELVSNNLARDETWTQSLAVGNREFVEEIQSLLGIRAKGREVKALGDKYLLREPPECYRPQNGSENGVLSTNNRFFWDIF